jgi:hypothetical protein
MLPCGILQQFEGERKKKKMEGKEKRVVCSKASVQ